MKKRGFDNQEIAEKLLEKGIEVKPPTLAKYLNQFRRSREQKQCSAPVLEKTKPAPQPDRFATVVPGRSVVTPDTSLDDF